MNDVYFAKIKIYDENKKVQQKELILYRVVRYTNLHPEGLVIYYDIKNTNFYKPYLSLSLLAKDEYKTDDNISNISMVPLKKYLLDIKIDHSEYKNILAAVKYYKKLLKLQEKNQEYENKLYNSYYKIKILGGKK